MTETNVNWLPHLVNAVPVRGYGKRLSTFTIALEGWRRGLNLKFYQEDNSENKLRLRYTLSSDTREHSFQSSMGDKVTEEAFEICDNKFLTKKYLLKANVPTPQGKMFGSDDSDSAIIDYAKKLGFPLVLKPTDANGGKGVFSNLKNEQSLKGSLKHVRNELGYKEVIIEEYVPGDEYRIIVIGDRVVGALNRVPANIIGDGTSTIKELIKEKNKERRKNPHLKSRMIKIDKAVIDLLNLNGYTLDSIPPEGKVIQLRLTSNLSTGGDSVDLTDKLTPELKKIAIEATKAIPGLCMSGIDMIVGNDQSFGTVIEVNTRPGLGGHLFPVDGTPRDLPKLIVDYYFPETKNIERSSLYFDFDAILEPIKNRTAQSVNVAPIPKGKIYSRRYIVSGDFDRRKYRLWIKRQALLNQLHGFSDITDNNDLEIVIAGINEQDVINFKNLFFTEPENFTVENVKVKEEIWDKPVQIGFETKSNTNLTKSEIRELLAKNERLQRENERLFKLYNRIQKSKAWRVTYPVRRVLHALKIRFRSLKAD